MIREAEVAGGGDGFADLGKEIFELVLVGGFFEVGELLAVGR